MSVVHIALCPAACQPSKHTHMNVITHPSRPHTCADFLSASVHAAEASFYTNMTTITHPSQPHTCADFLSASVRAAVASSCLPARRLRSPSTCLPKRFLSSHSSTYGEWTQFVGGHTILLVEGTGTPDSNPSSHSSNCIHVWISRHRNGVSTCTLLAAQG